MEEAVLLEGCFGSSLSATTISSKALANAS